MAYIVFDISLMNKIDLTELNKLKDNLPNKFKSLEFDTKTNYLKDMKLDGYYTENEYDDMKELATKLSKVLLNGEIRILVTETGEDDYGFLITPNKTTLLTRNCEWVKV